MSQASSKSGTIPPELSQVLTPPPLPEPPPVATGSVVVPPVVQPDGQSIVVPPPPPLQASPPSPPVVAPPLRSVAPASGKPNSPESSFNVLDLSVPPKSTTASKRSSRTASQELNQFSVGASADVSAGAKGKTKLKDLRLPDEEEAERIEEKKGWAVRMMFDMPSWLVSTIVHVAIILLLALIPIRNEIGRSISILMGTADGGDASDALTTFDLSNDIQVEESPSDNPMEDLSSKAMELVSTSDVMPSLDGPIMAKPSPLVGGLSGRSGLMKDALLKAYGGTGLTEQAVALGLEWLKRNQTSDGSWSLVGPYTDGSVTENKSAATALALLAFMGAGNTHKSGPYKENVSRGIHFLISLQDEDGFFAAKAAGNQRTYSQAQSTIAICELYGMTGDKELRMYAQRAVKYAENAQHVGGGWRYQPKDVGDTSVTGWYVMALISARMAGLDVDSEVLDRVHQFLNTVQKTSGVRGNDDYGNLYSYQAYTNPTPAMTAEGMLCRMYLGWATNDERISRGSDYLCEHLMSSDINERSYYYWYYATTSLHHIGGKNWTRWNDVMKEVLPAMQVPSGRERGSWSPQGDPHGAGGGRMYSTCLSILCLEAYYRHLPLSDISARK